MEYTTLFRLKKRRYIFGCFCLPYTKDHDGRWFRSFIMPIIIINQICSDLSSPLATAILTAKVLETGSLFLSF